MSALDCGLHLTLNYNCDGVESWCTGAGSRSPCTEHVPQHKGMNLAFSLWKTENWVGASRSLTADQICLLRPRQSQDSWAGAQLRLAKEEGTLWLISVLPCSSCRGFRGPCCLLVYLFSLAPKGTAGVKPFYGRLPRHTQVRALPPSTNGLQPPQGCSPHFINSRGYQNLTALPTCRPLTGTVIGTHIHTLLDLRQATDTTELHARNNYH